MDRLLYYFRPDEADAFYLFWSKQLLISLLIVAAFYLMSQLLRVAVNRVGTRLCSLTESDLDDRILDRLATPASWLVFFAGLYLAIKRLPLPDKVNTVVSGAIFVVNIGILANMAYRVMDEMLTRYGERVAGEEMSRQLIPLVKKVGSIFLYVTALIITLKHFNYDILSLVTALGVGSLAIGLAAKDTLANMISGFTLMIDRPFRIGDRIQMGTQMGDVVDIGLRSTKIKGFDNTYLIIPNSELCNTTLINHAYPDTRGKGRVNVGIAYGSDVEQAKALLLSIAASIPQVLPDPAPEVYFAGFGDSSLNLSLFFWVADYTQIFSTQDKINCAIYSSFKDNGINIPFPTRTVIYEKDPIHAPQD